MSKQRSLSIIAKDQSQKQILSNGWVISKKQRSLSITYSQRSESKKFLGQKFSEYSIWKIRNVFRSKFLITKFFAENISDFEGKIILKSNECKLLNGFDLKIDQKYGICLRVIPNSHSLPFGALRSIARLIRFGSPVAPTKCV